MTVAQDLGRVADLCADGAKKTLAAILALGPKPDGGPDALLWEQQSTRLQGQLNSLTALNSKLTAASVIAGLSTFAADLEIIGKASKDAQTRIAKIKAASELLTKLARVLDLGLALLAAAAAPSPATIGAVIKAGKAVADEV
ncbi:hypothetical protein WKW79_36125 [Variovorax robiniae]|uniref:Uncharacterized protein n=1 Tax=Variovorax robiniae TaxID=1836199 RepID=A0ABU8XLN6_9BURK